MLILLHVLCFSPIHADGAVNIGPYQLHCSLQHGGNIKHSQILQKFNSYLDIDKEFLTHGNTMYDR